MGHVKVFLGTWSNYLWGHVKVPLGRARMHDLVHWSQLQGRASGQDDNDKTIPREWIITLNGGDNYNFYTTEMKSYQAKRRLVVGKTNSHHIWGNSVWTQLVVQLDDIVISVLVIYIYQSRYLIFCILHMYIFRYCV